MCYNDRKTGYLHSQFAREEGDSWNKGSLSVGKRKQEVEPFTHTLPHCTPLLGIRRRLQTFKRLISVKRFTR